MQWLKKLLNKDIFSYASITNRDIVNDAKIVNHRYNMLYEIISRYKADKNIVTEIMENSLGKVFNNLRIVTL